MATALLSFGAVPAGYAQPQSGSVAIVAYNTDGVDDFAWVALADIPANTTINFTDSSWQGFSPGAFRPNEHFSAGGPLTWVHASPVSAGTVVRFTGSSSVSWSLGADTGASLNLASAGDQIFAYTGTSASPTFLYGSNFANTGWVPPPTVSNSSDTSNVPGGLSEAAGTAFHVGDFENGYYSGPTTGTQQELLAHIATQANWTRDDNGPLNSANWPTAFTVTPVPEPGAVLGLAAAGFGLAGLGRRVTRRSWRSP